MHTDWETECEYGLVCAWVFMFVCMHVYMSVCVCVCACTCMRVHVCVCAGAVLVTGFQFSTTIKPVHCHLSHWCSLFEEQTEGTHSRVCTTVCCHRQHYYIRTVITSKKKTPSSECLQVSFQSAILILYSDFALWAQALICHWILKADSAL